MLVLDISAENWNDPESISLQDDESYSLKISKTQTDEKGNDYAIVDLHAPETTGIVRGEFIYL